MKQVNMKKSDTVFLFSKKLLTTLSVMILFITARAQNTKYGTNALFSNTTGVNNSAFGTSALFSNTTGVNNSAFGTNAAAKNTTGSSNTVIGHFAGVGFGNLTNATAIGSNAIVHFSNAIQLGNNTVTKVFAGTGTKATLIAGGLQITGGVLGAGKVLTSDAAGIATWKTPAAGNDWSLTGNAGTVAGTNFIGTTDATHLVIKTNSVEKMRILDNGNVGIGTSTPASKLDVKGNLSITGGAGAELLGNAKLQLVSGYASPISGRIIIGDNTGWKTFISTKDANNIIRDNVTFMDNGNVGIGTSTPASKLDVKGNLSITGGAGAELLGNAKLQLVSGYASPISGRIIIGDNTGWKTFISTKDANNIIRDNVTFMDNGNVVVGNVVTKTGYKLFVEQGILTEKVRVAVKNGVDWADYVFDKNYELMPLQKVEEFIKTNNHLPNIPSASEAVKDGIDLGQMNAKLLSKIEELTLYMIEMNKKIEKLEQENASLKIAIVNTKK
jgi:hypothetical protein